MMEANLKLEAPEMEYVHSFQKAWENLVLVCDEYKGTSLCKRRRRKINKPKSIL
jgi:hypothetical protein